MILACYDDDHHHAVDEEEDCEIVVSVVHILFSSRAGTLTDWLARHKAAG